MNLMFAHTVQFFRIFGTKNSFADDLDDGRYDRFIQKAACNIEHQMESYQGRASVFASARSDLPIYFCRKRNEKSN